LVLGDFLGPVTAKVVWIDLPAELNLPTLNRWKTSDT
jgi:hypothetical protein